MNGHGMYQYGPIPTTPPYEFGQMPSPPQAYANTPPLPPRPFAPSDFHHPIPPRPPPYPFPSKVQYTPVAQEVPVRGSFRSRRSHRGIDFTTTILLFVVWGFLIAICLVLIMTAYVGSTSATGQKESVDGSEIEAIIALSTIPILLGTILNEVLVERCWKKIEYFALDSNFMGRKIHQYDRPKLARHLRAANFGWYKFLKRLFTGKLSGRDWRTLCSWMLLRWGTAISIASTQVCVSWTPEQVPTEDDENPVYVAHKRLYWIVVPVLLHSLAVFGTLAIWLKLPLSLFSKSYNDHGLLEVYDDYMQQIQGGSAATCDDVAKYLESPQQDRSLLEKKNKPGLQLRRKLRGVWFGLVMMIIPAGLSCLYTNYVQTDRSTILRTGLFRSVFHLIFLAQNIFYIVALDFIVWNLSLEGLCRSSKSAQPKPTRKLRLLGRSAGLLLFWKAATQRRPWRAAIFLWLFWLQACAMRVLTIVFIFCVQVIGRESINNRKAFYDPFFWYGYLMITGFVTYPLILVWFFTPFQAPICEQDGWRWANVVKAPLSDPNHELGFYGVIREGGPSGNPTYLAAWSGRLDAQSFKATKGETLS